MYPRLVSLLVVRVITDPAPAPAIGLGEIVHPRFRCLGLDHYVYIEPVVIMNPYSLNSIVEILAPSTLRDSETFQTCGWNSEAID